MKRPANIGTAPPPKPNRDQAPAVVRVRLWPEEYHRVCAKAREAGLPVKEWALRVVLGAVE